MSCHRQWSVTRMGQNYTPTAVLAVAIWLCVGAVGFCWVPQCSTYSHHHSNLRTWFRKALEFGLQWVTTCLTRTDAKCHMFNPIPSHATPCLKPITAIKNRLHEGPPPIKTSSFACLMYEYHMKHKKYPDLNIVYIYMIYMYILLYIYIYITYYIYIYWLYILYISATRFLSFVKLVTIHERYPYFSVSVSRFPPSSSLARRSWRPAASEEIIHGGKS